jgi:hypothetical protein
MVDAVLSRYDYKCIAVGFIAVDNHDRSVLSCLDQITDFGWLKKILESR